MGKKPTVFLESHNIKNQFFGFGQFNYHLIKALKAENSNRFDITIHVKDIARWKNEFGDAFSYKKYRSLSRHKLLSIRTKYDIWHSLNQNIKIEPYHDIPYILTVHDVNFIEEISKNLSHPRNIRFQEKLDRAKAITYISAFAKADTHKNFKVPNIPEFIILNGNPVTDDLTSTEYTPKTKVVGPFLYSIGEFSTRKNFHTLVKMLLHLPKYKLVLSGNDNTTYKREILDKTIKNLDIENRVIITGKVSELDKQYYLKNCTAFLFPSLREGFGIPPIEAMRFGKPIFLSNNTSLPEVGGTLAHYWNHYDPKYMADIVAKGIENFEADEENLSIKYTEHALSFNWNKAARQYLAVYESLC